MWGETLIDLILTSPLNFCCIGSPPPSSPPLGPRTVDSPPLACSSAPSSTSSRVVVAPVPVPGRLRGPYPIDVHHITEKLEAMAVRPRKVPMHAVVTLDTTVDDSCDDRSKFDVAEYSPAVAAATATATATATSTATATASAIAATAATAPTTATKLDQQRAVRIVEPDVKTAESHIVKTDDETGVMDEKTTTTTIVGRFTAAATTTTRVGHGHKRQDSFTSIKSIVSIHHHHQTPFKQQQLCNHHRHLSTDSTGSTTLGEDIKRYMQAVWLMEDAVDRKDD